MGYTHLQPAEPTTLGYRLAVYAQDLLIDRATLLHVREQLTAKGIRGAVGTSASYTRLLDGSALSPQQQEDAVLGRFELRARDVATQTYPRKLDYLLLSALAGLGASLSKFAFDVRIRPAPASATFRALRRQASRLSAMPFKRNPVMAERMLARPPAARVCRRGLAERRDQPARTHARRQREPPHGAARGAAVLRRDPLAGDQDRRAGCGSTSARSPRTCASTDRFGHRGGADGSGQARRRPPGAARGDPRERDAAYDALGRGETNPLARMLADDKRITRLVEPAEVRESSIRANTSATRPPAPAA